MTELNEHETELASGGVAIGTAASYFGNIAGEMMEHPEAVFMGPLIGAIYIYNKH